MNKLATVQGVFKDRAIPITFAQRGKRGFFAPSPGDRTFLRANLCPYEFAVATEAADIGREALLSLELTERVHRIVRLRECIRARVAVLVLEGGW